MSAAYALDLILGDPRRLPHPIRWIGKLIAWLDGIFYDKHASPVLQRMAGCAFWASAITAVYSGTIAVMGAASHLYPAVGHAALIWIAYTTMATRSLHKESAQVARALQQGDLPLARERLSRIVSRDTGQLNEKEIVRALVETVSENLSDGIVAPLFYLAIGGPPAAMIYKAINTMDSMVGYKNERYLYFGWFAARMDDLANLIPARLSALLLIGASACLRLDWRSAWRVMRRDARKMKSPNAGYPEAAAAGALKIQIGGANIYFGQAIEKPTLGDSENELTLAAYRSMVRLMYATSFLCFIIALIARYIIVSR